MESVLWKVIWKNNLFEVRIREDKGKVNKNGVYGLDLLIRKRIYALLQLQGRE